MQGKMGAEPRKEGALTECTGAVTADEHPVDLTGRQPGGGVDKVGGGSRGIRGLEASPKA